MDLEQGTVGFGMRMDRRRLVRLMAGVGTAAIAGGVLGKGASANSGPEFLWTTANLNLRAKASSSGKILLVMPAHSVVKNTGQFSNGYTKVNYQGTVGWAYSTYLDQAVPGDDGGSVDIIGTAVTTSAVNLRTGPSTSYSVLDVIKKGKTVQISDLVTGGYRFVVVNGVSGWIYDQYLDQGSSDEEGPIDFLTTAAVNLRKDPSTSGKIIKVVPKGATVTDYDLVMANGYRGVDYKGTVGWIYDAYLEEK